MLIETTFPESVDRSYLLFMQQPVIQNFLANGGQVYAATEGQSTDNIKRLLALGHRHFAEKYLQEAEQKYPSLIKLYPDIRLSYFGKLQTNKIGRIINLFHTIESVTRPKEVDVINRWLGVETAKTTTFFMQWNIGQEAQKNGASTGKLADLFSHCTNTALSVSGLMVIPPKHANPVAYFRTARQQTDRFGLSECQMGFSADYEEAIRCGSTRIRVARLFFGN